MKLGILKGFNDFEEFTKGSEFYAKSCEELGIDYEIIDFTSSDWIELIKSSDCYGFLVRTPCNIQERKSIFDERLYFLNKVMKKPIYPSFDEIFIYENKRNMSTWLKLFGFPHAETKVFMTKEESLDFINKTAFPLVFKTNIGSAASGVKIVKSKGQAKRIINNIFGIRPSLALGNLHFLKKFGLKIFPNIGEAQKHYVIIQEYKDVKWEWRLIKVGKSYFGQQKLLKGEFCSGSGLVGFVKPPDELLFMLKDICDKGNFDSMAVDILETKDGEYFVNELQTTFGYEKEDSEMYIDGIPGRFTFQNGEFVFEEGKFNKYGSSLLRVESFVQKLQELDKINNFNK